MQLLRLSFFVFGFGGGVLLNPCGFEQVKHKYRLSG